MSVKRELIAALVRCLAENTNLIRKPDPFESMLNSFFGVESYDQRIAENVEAEAERAIAAAKRFHTNRRFNKIISKI